MTLPITIEKAVETGLLIPEPASPGVYAVANLATFEEIVDCSLIEL